MYLDSKELLQDLGVPLGDIINLPLFDGSKVRAGKKGLTRLVKGINVMEVPDIINWVKPGQLLLTTGFAIRDDQKAQRDLIPALEKKHLAGICIKPRRYLDEIPATMLEQADACGFPVIELPLDINFADLIYEVLNAVLHSQTRYFLRMLDVHSTLMEIMIQGGGLQKLADTFVMLIDNPVFVQDLLNDRYAYGWNTSLKEMELLLAAFQDQRKAWEKERQHQQVRAGRFTVRVGEYDVGYYFLPITVASEYYGYVTIWETRRPLSSSDLFTIERLSVVAALEMARERSLREIERRYLNDFLDHLLTGRLEDEALEIEHAEKFGWDLKKSFVVSLIWLRADKDGMHHQDIKNRAQRELKRIIDKSSSYCLMGTEGDYVVLLLEVKNRDFSVQQIDREAKKQLEHFLQHLLQAFREWEIRISLGRFYPGIRGLQKSYEEARRAMQISNKLVSSNRVISFNDLGPYRLIYCLDREAELRTYLVETVGKLIEYDRENKTELVRTLQAYFKYHGNLKKVSSVLFTHYNTVLYRLERIQEISGYDLSNPEERFTLEVAVKLLEFADFNNNAVEYEQRGGVGGFPEIQVDF